MTIVVGFTHRPEGELALRRAIDEARLRGARLYIVRLLDRTPSVNPGQVEQWDKQAAEGQQEGEAIVARLAEEGVEAKFEFEPGSTPAAARLLAAAQANDADLVVIGIRRRSPVGKLVLGSVSQEVLLGAECPVLAVKADDAS
jgi:nucleotide-binding universal stress UspA family protein